MAQSLPTPAVSAQLLALNRTFYAQANTTFDITRQNIPPGMARAVEAASLLPAGVTPRVLDVGCGNGRLARALAALGRPVAYTGIDADAGLLAAAAEQTSPLAQQGIVCRFVQSDVTQPDWSSTFGRETFDFVACLATLHHLPGRALRRLLLRALADRVAPGGRLVVSAWQFSDSPRLVARIVPWSVLGIDPADVEPGDALLPWDAGKHLLRYVHLIDAAEMLELGAAAGLTVLEQWRSDGRTNDLTLYTTFERAPHAQGV